MIKLSPRHVDEQPNVEAKLHSFLVAEDRESNFWTAHCDFPQYGHILLASSCNAGTISMAARLADALEIPADQVKTDCGPPPTSSKDMRTPGGDMFEVCEVDCSSISN